jgi:hypothetical protein
LGAGGKLFKAGDQTGEELVELGVVEGIIRETREESVEQFADVLKCGSLEFAGAVEIVVEDGESLLGGFAGGAQLVEAAALVELLDGGGVGVVRSVVEVAPGAELLECGYDGGGVECLVGREGGLNLGRAERDDEAGAFGDEETEDGRRRSK